jgi:hypothetical protein
MKPRPTVDSEPAYPSRRKFIQTFGAIAAGAGLGALSMSPALAGERLPGEPPIPRKPVQKKMAFCAKTCGKEIDKLVLLLSDDDFRKRKQATQKLIAIGKGVGRDKKVAAQMRQLILSKMTKLKNAKDPEVAQRAKAVILAVSPPKKNVIPRRPIAIKGDVAEIID